MARKITEGMTKLVTRFLEITGKRSDQAERTIAGLTQCYGEKEMNEAMDVLESHWINNMAWWDGKPIEPMTLVAESCHRGKEQEVG